MSPLRAVPLLAATSLLGGCLPAATNPGQNAPGNADTQPARTEKAAPTAAETPDLDRAEGEVESASLEQRLRKILAQCPELGAPVDAALLELERDGPSVPGEFEFEFEEDAALWRFGRMGYSTGTYDGGNYGRLRVLRKEDCSNLGEISFEWMYASAIKKIGIEPRPSPALMAAAHAYFDWSPYDASDVGSAYARLLFSRVGESSLRIDAREKLTVRGPEFRAQPWFDGPPQATPAVLAAKSDAYLAAGDPTPSDASDFLAVVATGPPHKAWEGREYAIFHCAAIGPRLRPPGIVLFDRAHDRHRWVGSFPSEAGDVTWVGERDGIALAYYRSGHPGGPFTDLAGVMALRLSDGALFRLDVSGSFEDGSRVDAFEEMELIDVCTYGGEDGETPSPQRCEALTSDTRVRQRAREFEILTPTGSWEKLNWRSVRGAVQRAPAVETL